MSKKNTLVGVLTAELFNEFNALKCGKNLDDVQPFLKLRPNVSQYIKGLYYPVPQEGFRPKIAIAIDFLHQYTLNTNPKVIPAQPLVDRNVLRKEAARILRFVNYYFDYTESFNYKGKKLKSANTYASHSIDTDQNINLFLNEIFNFFVTDISVTRARRDIGTATVSFRNVRNYRNGIATTTLFNNIISVYQQLLTPMLPIKIWAKGRFYTNYYFPIFDGYLVTISNNDSAGFATLELSCKDILEVARFSNEMVNPALVVIAELKKRVDINLLSQPFFGLDHMDIFKSLFLGGHLAYDPSNRKLSFETIKNAHGIKPKKVFVDGIGYVTNNQEYSQAISTLEHISKSGLGMLSSLAKIGSSEYNINQGTANGTQEGTNVPSVNLDGLGLFEFLSNTDAATVDKLPLVYDDRGAIRQNEFSMVRLLADLNHQSNPRKLLAWGADVTPYRIFNVQTPDIWTSEFSSRLEIMQQISEMTYYDFYVDGAGNVHYHPQRLANDFLLYDTDYFKVNSRDRYKNTSVWPCAQVLGPEEIINNTPNINSEQMVTFLTIRGKDPVLSEQLRAELGELYGTATHKEFLARYGYRRQLVENPIFNVNFSLDKNAPNSASSAAVTFADLLAAALLEYTNAELYTTTCSMIFRPEIDLARPVFFVEDNSVFYVNSITHTVSIGGDATTTINASFGRKDSELPPDLNSFVLAQDGLVKYTILGEAEIDQMAFIKSLPIARYFKYLDSRQILALARTQYLLTDINDKAG